MPIEKLFDDRIRLEAPETMAAVRKNSEVRFDFGLAQGGGEAIALL